MLLKAEYNTCRMPFVNADNVLFKIDLPEMNDRLELKGRDERPRSSVDQRGRYSLPACLLILIVILIVDLDKE